MPDPTIPPAAVQAASAAIERVMQEAAHPLSYAEMGRAATVAAAPFLAEHIAQRIALNVRNPDHSRQDRGKWFTVPTSMAYVDGHDNAARIVREAFPKGPTDDAPAEVIAEAVRALSAEIERASLEGVYPLRYKVMGRAAAVAITEQGYTIVPAASPQALEAPQGSESSGPGITGSLAYADGSTGLSALRERVETARQFATSWRDDAMQRADIRPLKPDHSVWAGIAHVCAGVLSALDGADLDELGMTATPITEEKPDV